MSAKRASKAVPKETARRDTSSAATPKPDPKAHLPYGQGQREQYGEGYAYRREELSKAADESTSSTWAGGDHTVDEAAIPETAPKNKKPKSD